MSNKNKTPYKVIKARRTSQIDVEAQKRMKRNKFMNIFFPTLGVAVLATGIGLMTYGLIEKSKAINVTTTPHSINFKETPGWQITGPTNAKFGDKVKFEVTSTTNELGKEIPDTLKMKDVSKSLHQSDTNKGIYETEEFGWPFIEPVEISVTTKRQTLKTYNVIFNLNGGVVAEGQEATLVTTVNENALFESITKPSFAAPKDLSFDHWEDEKGNNPLSSSYIIGTDTIFKAIYRKSESIEHTINFILDEDETLLSGDSTLVIPDGMKWGEVKKLTYFPVITKANYEIGSYYIYNGSESKLLDDDYIFTFDYSTNLSINITWTSQKKTITFRNTDKTTFASGESEEKIEVLKNTQFAAVARPVVLSTTVGTTRYVPNGNWYTNPDLKPEHLYSGSVVEEITLYAGYDEVTTLTHTYTVNFVNAYGFAVGTETQWKRSHEEEHNYTWADVKASAPTVDQITFPDGKLSNESKYKFIGWSITNDATSISEGVTNVIAKFEAKEVHYYSVIFTSDEQVAWSGSQSFWFETTDSSKAQIKDLENIAIPIKYGSTLVGWTYSTIKGGVKSEVEIKGTNWQTTFNNLKFSEIMDEDATITFKPIFEADSTKHLIYFLSSDTTKGTVSAKEGYSVMTYVDNTTTFGSIKQNIVYSPKPGYQFTKYRNGANDAEMKDTDLITTDTVVYVDFTVILFYEDTNGYYYSRENETSSWTLTHIPDQTYFIDEIREEIFGYPVTNIDQYLAKNCSSMNSLRRVVLPPSIKNIGESAFEWCTSLSDVSMPGVENVGNKAFYKCGVVSVTTQPKALKTIGDYGFYGCTYLRELDLSSLCSIGVSALCSSYIKTIEVSANLTSLDATSFSSLPYLQTFTIHATTPPTCNGELFTKCSSLNAIYVPEESIGAYRSADYWKDHLNIIQTIS